MSQYNKIMKDTGGKPELEPRCMIQGNERRQQAAVTNRGHLIPCCWIDQTEELKHPTMQKILAVSKISEVESIDEILLSEPWQKFAKDLAENNFKEIMPVCVTHCIKRYDKDKLKDEEYHIKGKKMDITNPGPNSNKTWEYKEKI
jgi:hypothetical protein|tara:strand:- start:1058 stop:1492 length:435 start_codon:yes stop_codon:yes gene_type:complete